MNENNELGMTTKETSRNLRLTFDWMMHNPDWQLFTATVTMKTKRLQASKQPIENMKSWTTYNYKNRVLNKVRRRLCRSKFLWNKVLPIDYIYQYEFEQGSYFKQVPKDGAPHHIHAVFPVKRDLAERIFDFSIHQLDLRLHKDLRSLDCVSSFLIEPLRYEEGHKWLSYLLKDKTLDQLNL
jgi:hypothetical protein